MITVLDARTGQLVRRIELGPDRPAGVGFSPDGRTLEVALYGDAGGQLLRLDPRRAGPARRRCRSTAPAGSPSTPSAVAAVTRVDDGGRAGVFVGESGA